MSRSLPVLAALMLVAPALAEPPKDAAGRTLRQACARVISADLQGQDVMIKSL